MFSCCRTKCTKVFVVVSLSAAFRQSLTHSLSDSSSSCKVSGSFSCTFILFSSLIKVIEKRDY
jgi:hypothetical protein